MVLGHAFGKPEKEYCQQNFLGCRNTWVKKNEIVLIYPKTVEQTICRKKQCLPKASSVGRLSNRLVLSHPHIVSMTSLPSVNLPAAQLFLFRAPPSVSLFQADALFRVALFAPSFRLSSKSFHFSTPPYSATPNKNNPVSSRSAWINATIKKPGFAVSFWAISR